MKNPAELDKDSLVDIVRHVQEGLFLDIDDNGQEFINPDKSIEGADYIDHVAQILQAYGLVPEEMPGN